MYWNSVPAASVNFDVLLNKEDVTLQEVMDDDAILQECRSQNKRLIEYLVKSDILEKLVNLTIEEPSGDEDDATKYKYSNIACELLTCEVPQLTETLANDKALLGKLYSFLETDAPLNPLLASFFSKTLSVLITRSSERNLYSYHFTCLKVLEFLKLKEDSISLLLKHLGTSAIMDLILKLVTKVEGSELKDIVLNWLDEQKLIQRLVALLDPSVDSDRHYNVAQLLCDLIHVLRINKMEVSQQNKILSRLESPEVVNLLLDHILKEPRCETSIVGGISVLLALLEDKWHSNDRVVFRENTQDYLDYLKVVASTTKAILPRLKDFHDILINPPLKSAVRTTIAVLEPPLGSIRVEVAKLLSVLVASYSEEINKELAELDTINILLDLFFKYTWNNFLHTQVQKCLLHAFDIYPTAENGETHKNSLVAYILSKCRIIQRILEAWQDNETQQTEHKRPRRGYMGHLIKIAHKIYKQAQTHSFGALMKETVDNETLNKWENFVNTKLYEIQETYMGRSYHLSDKDDNAGKNDSFGDFSQVLYSNYYQLQALAPSFTGEFGAFQKDQFNEDEDTLENSGNPDFEKINFTAPEEETDQQAVFFEKVCAQKFQTLDDYNGYDRNQDLSSELNDNVERVWQALENSSSDEEDNENLEKSTNPSKEDDSVGEFNKLPAWPCIEMPFRPAYNVNSWESATMNPVTSPDLEWANFESAPFAPNFGLNLTSDINTTIATSTSYDIDTISLDLTPNENNSNIDDLFSKDESQHQHQHQHQHQPEPQIETPQVEENNPTPIEYTDLDIITKGIDKVSLNAEDSNSTNEEKEDSVKTECQKLQKIENETAPKEEGQVNCIENSAIGDVNSVGNNMEEKKLHENFRFLSSQGFMTNSEREPEGGDSYQLIKENVQAVPNETFQTSNKEIESNSPEDKSANGPI